MSPLQDSLRAERDPYSQWSFQDVFSEDSIVLDPVSVLPVQYEITNCLLPFSPGRETAPPSPLQVTYHTVTTHTHTLTPLTET